MGQATLRPTKKLLRRSVAGAVASSEAAQLIEDGKAKFEARDRMGAMAQFEAAAMAATNAQDRQVACFNLACVHASFGDVEPAQQCLRDAVDNGLVMDAALKDPTLLKLSAAPQVIVQLKKFVATTQRQRQEQRAAAASAAAAPPPRMAGGSGASANSSGGGGSSGSTDGSFGSSWRQRVDADLSDVLGTEANGIDASLGAIVRRVTILLVVGLALGVTLFYLGLKYAFPESPY